MDQRFLFTSCSGVKITVKNHCVWAEDTESSLILTRPEPAFISWLRVRSALAVWVECMILPSRNKDTIKDKVSSRNEHEKILSVDFYSGRFPNSLGNSIFWISDVYSFSPKIQWHFDNVFFNSFFTYIRTAFPDFII